MAVAPVMRPSAIRSKRRSQTLTTAIVAYGHAAARPVDDGPHRDLPEQERREQQAEAGEIADVGIANRDADLGAAQQENPAQAPERSG